MRTRQTGNGKWRRLLSVLLAAFMLLGMLPMGALAAEHSNVVDAGPNGMQDSNEHGGAVRVNKTVAQSDRENYIDVTLEVETTAVIKDIPSSAAVVLVVDMSGSMKDEFDRSDRSRAWWAKDTVKDFIETYARGADAFDAPRMLSVVQFGTDAQTVDLPGSRDGWVDLAAEGVSVNRIQDSIDDKVKVGFAIGRYNEDSGATNLSGGLLLARNLVAQLKRTEDIENVTVILLSDGEPTARLVGGGPNGQNRYAGVNFDEWGVDYTGGVFGEKIRYRNTMDSPVTERIDGTTGSTWNGGSDSDKWKVAATRYQAGKIQDMGVDFYSVAYALSDKDKLFDNQTTVYQFLQSISDEAYPANDVRELEGKFRHIVDQILLSINAWTVVDPLAQYMTDPTITDVANGNAAEFADGVLHWNLKSDFPEGDGARKRYSLTYQITIDNLASGFPFDDALAVNTMDGSDSETLLTYTIDDPSTPMEDVYTTRFPVPTVKAYRGDLEFIKKRLHDGEPMRDVEFELTHEGGYSKDEASNRDGYVAFRGIPSGWGYQLTEDAPNGYADLGTYTVGVRWGQVTLYSDKGAEVARDGGRYTVTNALKPIKGDLTLVKQWLPEGLAGYPTVTFDLIAKVAGQEVEQYSIRGVEVTPGDNWRKTVEVDLRDANTGRDISYEVVERALAGWSAQFNGAKPSKHDDRDMTYTFTNTRAGQQELSVRKVWQAPEGTLPAELRVDLLANNAVVGTVTLNAANDWQAGFGTKPLYDSAGAELAYTVEERDLDPKFAAVGAPVRIETEHFNGFELTNKIQPERFNINGIKTWDPTVPAGVDSVTVELYRDDDGNTPYRTATASAPDWAYSFTDLPKYSDDGMTAYRYHTVDDAGEHYRVQRGDEANSWQLTNRQTMEYVQFEAVKTWVGDADLVETPEAPVDGEGGAGGEPPEPTHTARPASVTLALMRTVTGGTEEVAATLTLNGADFAADATGWNGGAFAADGSPDFPVRDAQNRIYTYFVREQGLQDGMLPGQGTFSYKPTYGQDGTVTNTLFGGETSILVNKVWNAPADELPDILRYEVTVAGDDATVAASADKVTAEVLAQAVPDWSHSFTLPAYDNGQPIAYRVREVLLNVEGETETVLTEGFTSTVDRSANADGAVVLFTNTVTQQTQDIRVVKQWVGAEAATRPAVEIVLSKAVGDGQIEVARRTVGAETPLFAGHPSVVFEDLPIYDLESQGAGRGQRIVYRVSEVLPDGSHYSSQTVRLTEEHDLFETLHDAAAASTYLVTNTFVPGSMTVTGTKNWYHPQGTQLPGSIEVTLLSRDAERADAAFVPVEMTGNPVTVTPDGQGNWFFRFENLPRYNGLDHRIAYSVAETPVDGWTTAVTETGEGTFVIANTTVQEELSLTLTKVWHGPLADREALEFVPVTVRQMLNGTATGWTMDFEIPNPGEGSHWSLQTQAVFPKYNADRTAAYSYAVKETLALSGYTATTPAELPQTVVNTVAQQQVEVFGKKVWQGEGPTYDVAVELWADGRQTNLTQPVVGGVFRFADLPKYALGETVGTVSVGSGGEEIAYTVREVGAINGAISFTGENGRDNFLVQIAYNEQDGWVVTNAKQGTDLYRYTVNTHYSYLERDVNGTPIEITRRTEIPGEDNGQSHIGTKDLAVSIPAESYALFGDGADPANDPVQYPFDRATLTSPGVGGEEPEPILQEGDQVDFVLQSVEGAYVVDLYYTLEKQMTEDPVPPLPAPEPLAYAYRVDRTYTHRLTLLDNSVTEVLEDTVTGEEQVFEQPTAVTVGGSDSDLVNFNSYRSHTPSGSGSAYTYSYLAGGCEGTDGTRFDLVFTQEEPTVSLELAEDGTLVITLHYLRTSQQTGDGGGDDEGGSVPERPNLPGGTVTPAPTPVPTPTPTPEPTPVMEIAPGLVPLADIPDPALPPAAPEIIILEPEIIILESDVPLMALPKTGMDGDSGRKNGLFAAMSMGLLTLAAALGLRKREETEG